MIKGPKIRAKTPHYERELQVVFQQYRNNDRIAIELLDAEDNEPWCVASVNVDDWDMPDDCVLLKGWSENEGIPDALVAAGLVEMTGRRCPTGFVEAEEAKILWRPDEATQVTLGDQESEDGFEERRAHLAKVFTVGAVLKDKERRHAGSN